MMDLEHSANVVFSKWVYSICIYGYGEINFYYYNIALRRMDNKNQKIVNVGNIRMYVLKVILRVI